jgi:hypothetical protein
MGACSTFNLTRSKALAKIREDIHNASDKDLERVLEIFHGEDTDLKDYRVSGFNDEDEDEDEGI